MPVNTYKQPLSQQFLNRELIRIIDEFERLQAEVDQIKASLQPKKRNPRVKSVCQTNQLPVPE